MSIALKPARTQHVGTGAHSRGRAAVRISNEDSCRYDKTVTAGAKPSFLDRRANLRSSNVATLSQAL